MRRFKGKGEIEVLDEQGNVTGIERYDTFDPVWLAINAIYEKLEKIEEMLQKMTQK